MKRTVPCLLTAAVLLCLFGCRGRNTAETSSYFFSPAEYDTSYIAPFDGSSSADKLSPPSRLSSGYPVSSAEGNKISSPKLSSNRLQSESKKTETSSSPQETNLSYLPPADTYYHGFLNLTPGKQQIYAIMVSAIENMRTGKIPLGVCELGDVAQVFIAVRGDHPEFFWLSSDYVLDTSSDGSVFITFQSDASSPGGARVSYNCTRAERDAMSAKLNTAVKNIVAAAPRNAGDYEIECWLNEWLCNHVTYNPDKALKLTSYAALVEGAAVCEGYARAMQLLLAEFSIPSLIVNGTANGQGHMWNMVKLSGEWYHLDVTWNDLWDGNFTIHGYLNMNDSRVGQTHTIDPDFTELTSDKILSGVSCNISLPAASSDRYFYPAVNGFILNDDIENSVLLMKQKLYCAISEGKSYCEFYIDSVDTDIETKYDLLGCVNEVNNKSARKIKVTGTMRSDKTVVLLIKYEGE